MKTLLIALLLTTVLTGCGGYNVKEDGIIGAPIGTMLYWMFAADKEEAQRIHTNQIVNCGRYGYGCNQPQTVVVNPNFPR